jgi:hypothetical protein
MFTKNPAGTLNVTVSKLIALYFLRDGCIGILLYTNTYAFYFE